MSDAVNAFMEKVKAKNPAEPEFHQAVFEVATSVMPFIEKNPKYRKTKILERVAEPERVILFRVPWLDDSGEIQVNRGFRIEMNSAIGPYKGENPNLWQGIVWPFRGWLGPRLGGRSLGLSGTRQTRSVLNLR